MRRALALLLAALAVTAGVVGSGLVLGGGDPDTDDPAVAAPVRLSGLDLSGLDLSGPDAAAVPREPFCARLGGEVVTEALGAAAEHAVAWTNGDRLRLAPGVRDVAHEHGCRWRAAGGGVVEAWVFAPPVTTERAADLARVARRAPGCRRLPGAAGARLGDPSVGLLCRADGALAASYRGLLGDAWLTCRVRQPDFPGSPAGPADPVELADRTDRWCGAVLSAAAG